MKKLIILTGFIFFNSLICLGQDIKPAPEDKAVIYFVRISSIGFAVNFRYFDSTEFIGKFNGPKYLRYECKPGKHLFWAQAENKDFVEANVEAGKIYFIEAIPKMGAIKAGVKLIPVDTRNEKIMKKIHKLFSKKPSESFSTEELEKETKKIGSLIVLSLKKYKKKKEKGKTIVQLEKTMYYNQ